MRLPPTNIAGYNPTLHTAGCEWDADAAARVLDFFPAVITHPDRSPGAKPGDPFRWERWQKDYLATLYGWRRPDGTRRNRRSGKKQAAPGGYAERRESFTPRDGPDRVGPPRTRSAADASPPLGSGSGLGLAAG